MSCCIPAHADGGIHLGVLDLAAPWRLRSRGAPLGTCSGTLCLGLPMWGGAVDLVGSMPISRRIHERRRPMSAPSRCIVLEMVPATDFLEHLVSGGAWRPVLSLVVGRSRGLSAAGAGQWPHINGSGVRRKGLASIWFHALVQAVGVSSPREPGACLSPLVQGVDASERGTSPYGAANRRQGRSTCSKLGGRRGRRRPCGSRPEHNVGMLQSPPYGGVGKGV